MVERYETNNNRQDDEETTDQSKKENQNKIRLYRTAQQIHENEDMFVDQYHAPYAFASLSYVSSLPSVQIGGPSASDQVNSRIIGTLLVPGFTNQYNLTMKGNTVPIKYSILDGSLVGMLADPFRKSLDLAVNPGANGGALEVGLPRHAVDSKNAAGQDTPFIVKIDGTRVSGEPSGICVGKCPNIFNSFKETHTTNTESVDYSLWSRK